MQLHEKQVQYHNEDNMELLLFPHRNILFQRIVLQFIGNMKNLLLLMFSGLLLPINRNTVFSVVENDIIIKTNNNIITAQIMYFV